MSCAMPADGGPVSVTDDALLGGRVVLRQPVSGLRTGTDAVLVAGAVRAAPGQRVADFGAGAGGVGLMVAARCPGIDLTMVEIDAELAGLARLNAARNGVEATVLASDVATAALTPGALDHVVMNPPFHPEHTPASPDLRTALARTAVPALLAHWLAASRRALRSGGVLTLIHRADALAEVLAALRPGFACLTVVPVQPRRDAAAARVIVAAVKDAKGPLTLERPLVLHDDSGGFSAEARGLHEGAALDRALPSARRLRARRPSYQRR